MKKISFNFNLFALLIILTNFPFIAQAQNEVLEDFKGLWENVVTNNVNHKKYIETLKSAGTTILMDTLWKESKNRNTCEHIQDCYNYVWDHDEYYNIIRGRKKPLRANTWLVNNVFQLETNKRSGTDLKSNIESLSKLATQWSVNESSNPGMTLKHDKEEIKLLFDQLKAFLITKLGQPRVITKGKTITCEWGYPSIGKRYTSLKLKYDKDSDDYVILADSFIKQPNLD